MPKADSVYDHSRGPRKARSRRPEIAGDDPALLVRDLALLTSPDPEAGRTMARDADPTSDRPPPPDAELLALGAELEALGQGLHDWPDDDEVERLDTRLAEVEERIAALVPATGAGLAVKLRL